jgi:hypothetical protein
MQARLTPPHLRALILGMALTPMGIIITLHVAHPFVWQTLPFVLVSCYPGTFLEEFSCFWSPEHKRYFFMNFLQPLVEESNNPLPPPPQMFFPLLFPHVELLPPFFFLSFSMVHFVLRKHIHRCQEQDGSSFNAVVQNGSPPKKKKKKKLITQIFVKTQKGVFFFFFSQFFCYKTFGKIFQKNLIF